MRRERVLRRFARPGRFPKHCNQQERDGADNHHFRQAKSVHSKLRGLCYSREVENAMRVLPYQHRGDQSVGAGGDEGTGDSDRFDTHLKYGRLSTKTFFDDNSPKTALAEAIWICRLNLQFAGITSAARCRNTNGLILKPFATDRYRSLPVELHSLRRSTSANEYRNLNDRLAPECYPSSRMRQAPFGRQ